MTTGEKARQLIAEAKKKTNTFREVMSTIRAECVAMPAGSGANEIHEHAMSILFTEMYDAPHGGASNE